MQNKNTSPTLVFTKEELLEKKRITSFLRTNNVEFTPKKNYYDDYEATIKVKNLTPTKQRKVLQILQDKESLNKIEFMFNLLPTLSDNSASKKHITPEKSPKKSRSSSPSKKQVNSAEKENANHTKQPSSAPFLSEIDFPSSLDHLAVDSKVGSETQLKGRSSPSRDLLHKVKENKEKGAKVSPQKRSLTSTESPKKTSPGTNKKSPPKSSSQKDVSSTRGYSSDGRLIQSYSKESKFEEQSDNQKLLAIASSLGRLHLEQAPTVTPFKIVTETATSLKDQKEEVNSMLNYSSIETPTLGPQVYQRESRPNSITNVKKSSDAKSGKQDSHIYGSNRSLSPKKTDSKRDLSSKRSSPSNLFTLRGEERLKEKARSSKNVSRSGSPGSPQRNQVENDMHSSFEEDDEAGVQFKQWTDLIMQDDFFRQLFSKIKENTGKSETESLILLISMLQDQQTAIEKEADENSTRVDSMPAEVSKPTKGTNKSKKLESIKNSTPIRTNNKAKEVKSIKPNSSQSAAKGSQVTLLNKSETKKTPISSEKLNKSNPKLKESSSVKKKKEQGNVNKHLNTSIGSSKGFQISLNTEPIIEVDSKNDINNTGRFPHQQNPWADLGAMKQPIQIEDHDDPSNLSLGPDKFEDEGRGSYNGYLNDDLSSIQHHEKSMFNTRGIFDTHGFDMSFDEKDKQYKEMENLYRSRKENERFGCEGEYNTSKDRNMSPENPYKHNSQIMRNLNNIILRSPYNSAATSKKNSVSKVHDKSELLNTSGFSSKISSNPSIMMGSASIRTAASSWIEEEKGKAERRRFTREKYNEYTRRIFQGLICHLSEKQERLTTKESQDGQAPYEQLDTEGMTKYFKLLLAKKNLLTIEQHRKKPQGETSLLLY